MAPLLPLSGDRRDLSELKNSNGLAEETLFSVLVNAELTFFGIRVSATIRLLITTMCRVLVKA